MKVSSIIIGFFLCEILLIEVTSPHVNTVNSQQKSKKLAEFRKKNPLPKKRKLELSEDSTIDLVYKRCDHGHTPDSLDDCTKYKTDNSSCCMFSYGVDSGCVLIGFQYLGTKTVGDMTITCGDNYLQLFKFMTLILSLLLL